MPRLTHTQVLCSCLLVLTRQIVVVQPYYCTRAGLPRLQCNTGLVSTQEKGGAECKALSKPQRFTDKHAVCSTVPQGWAL